MRIFKIKIAQTLSLYDEEPTLDLNEPTLDLNEPQIKLVRPKNNKLVRPQKNQSSLRERILNLYGQNQNLISSINRHLIDMTDRFFMADDYTLNTKGKMLPYLGGNYQASKEEQELFKNVTYQDLVNIGLFKIVNLNRKMVLKSAFNDIRNFK